MLHNKVSMLVLSGVFALSVIGCSGSDTEVNEDQGTTLKSSQQTQKVETKTVNIQTPIVQESVKQAQNVTTPNKKPIAIINGGVREVTLCQSGGVAFDATQSYDSDGSIVEYKWMDQEGRLLSEEATFSRGFPYAGTYIKTLMVTDDKGATATATLRLEVKAPIEWTKLQGTMSSDLINGMSTDKEGNAVAVGYTRNTGSSSDRFDVNVMKVSKLGDIIWSNEYNSSAHEIGYDSAVDSQGNIYVAVMTKGDFGDQNRSCGTDKMPDAGLLKLNSDGVFQWGRMICSDKAGLTRGIDVDAHDNVYITGNINGTLEALPNLGKNDIFVAKYDSSGDQKYLIQLGSDQNDYADSLVTDTSGNAYIAGYTAGDIAGSVGDYDILVSKISTEGKVVWQEQFGSSEADKNPAISIDKERKKLYVTGKTKGNVAAANMGSYDIFVTALNFEGQILWKDQYGSSAGEMGEDLVVDDYGNLFVTGYTEGDLEGETTKGYADIFLTKFLADGSRVKTISYGTPSRDYPYAIGLTQCNTLYIGGYTRGDLQGEKHSGGLNDKFISHFDLNKF
ncbi:MAG: SBBP repeat-containing protein [Epsilonproteobacteria bacterium]|nr:SBBP repeat-containing protein [Campylobacterota bacterium]